MNAASTRKRWVGLIALGCFLSPKLTLACATCFGAPNAPLTRGMNAGIIALLGVTALVLGGFAAFMVHLVRRAKLFSDESLPFELTEQKERVL